MREAIGFIAAIADRRGIALKLTATASELQVKGDPVQLQQVLLNLIINAMDAISEADGKEREVTVATSLREGLRRNQDRRHRSWNRGRRPQEGL